MGTGSDGLDGADAGEWIAERLSAYRGAAGRRLAAAAVGGTVPDCFDSYVRIFHAASGPDRSRASWKDVAAAQNTVWHPEMQFNAITGGSWPGSAPPVGRLDLEQLMVLGEVLGRHTSTPDRIFLALWEGWGGTVTQERLDESVVPADLLAADLLDVGNGFRRYLVVRGSIRNLQIPPWPGEGPVPNEETPNLAWPADRAWCLATEIDFDSTLVGGSAELIAAVVEHPGLEALEVGTGTSLHWDADTVNPRPRPPMGAS
jgi:hypothetical protein